MEETLKEWFIKFWKEYGVILTFAVIIGAIFGKVDGGIWILGGLTGKFLFNS